MAKNLSAVKRVQVAARNNQSNKRYKSAIKTMARKILTELTEVESVSGKTSNFSNDKLHSLTSQLYSKIDKAVKKGVIHKNSAARKKSRLARRIGVI